MKRILLALCMFLSFTGVAYADTFQSWLYNSNQGLYHPRFDTDSVCIGCSSTTTLGSASRLTLQPSLSMSAFLLELRSGFYLEGYSPTNGLLHFQNGINGGANEGFLGYSTGGVDYNIFSSIGVNRFTGPTYTATTTVGAAPITRPINFRADHSPGDGDGRYVNGDQVNYKIYSYKFFNNQKQLSTSTAQFTQSAQGINDGQILTWTPVTGADGYRILSSINTTNYDTYLDCTAVSCNGQYLDFLGASWLSSPPLSPTYPADIFNVFGNAVIAATTTTSVLNATTSISLNGTFVVSNGAGSYGNVLSIGASGNPQWVSTSSIITAAPVTYADKPGSRFGGGLYDEWHMGSPGNTQNLTIVTFTATTSYFYTFTPRGKHVIGISAMVTTGVVNGWLQCGIYQTINADDMRPGALVGYVNLSASGAPLAVMASTSLTLDPTKKYDMWIFSSSTPSVRGLNVGSYDDSFGLNNVASSWYTGIASTSNFGPTPPTTFMTDNVAAHNGTLQTTALPSCLLQYDQ